MAPPPYSSVIEECPGHPAAAEVPWVQFTIPSATCEDRVEEIYEDLCYVKFTSATPEVAVFDSPFISGSLRPDIYWV